MNIFFYLTIDFKIWAEVDLQYFLLSFSYHFFNIEMQSINNLDKVKYFCAKLHFLWNELHPPGFKCVRSLLVIFSQWKRVDLFTAYALHFYTIVLECKTWTNLYI